VSRLGISLKSNPGGVARGGFTWNNNLYEVYSQELKKVTDVITGTTTTIGTIAGSEVIRTAIGFNDAVIVVKGGAIYTLDKSDVLTDISGNANFVPCDDVAHINGRFVYIPTSGEPAFFSDVGAAGTVQPLSFFDAEELPDKNNAVFNFKNTLYICGIDSIQLFRNVGVTTAAPNAFLPVTNARILNGFIGGLLEYNSAFLFIGREKDQNFGIYAVTQGIAPKISNEAIDLILSTYTIEELKKAITGRFKHNGNDIATFRLSRDSFGFFAGNWFLLETVEEGVRRPWSAGFITQFEGDYYTAFSDRLGKLEEINTDYGFSFPRIIRTALEQEDGNNFSYQSLELGLSQGFNPDTIGSVGLRTSVDNVIYGDYTFETTANIGEYGNKISWDYPGGLGMYPGFLGIELYTVDDIIFNADYLILKP